MLGSSHLNKSFELQHNESIEAFFFFLDAF